MGYLHRNMYICVICTAIEALIICEFIFMTLLMDICSLFLIMMMKMKWWSRLTVWRSDFPISTSIRVSSPPEGLVDVVVHTVLDRCTFLSGYYHPDTSCYFSQWSALACAASLLETDSLAPLHPSWLRIYSSIYCILYIVFNCWGMRHVRLLHRKLVATVLAFCSFVEYSTLIKETMHLIKAVLHCIAVKFFPENASS